MAISKVLLVDDEANVTSGLKRALRHESFEILTANSAQEALGRLASADIDVVISDERMPGMPGSVFLAEVRRRYPDTVRMILSGQANLEDVIRAINEGEIYRFFLKPFNATDLGVTIRQAIQYRQLVRQSRALLHKYQKQCAINQRQAALLADRETSGSSLLHVETDDQGAIVLTDDEDCGVDTLLQKIEGLLTRR
jgi:DNA-binding NtrC family response regulator